MRPNKKILVFRVTRPFLNLLVKPRSNILEIVSGFQEKKYIILCILKGDLSCKMHKIIYFFKKKCVPTLPKIFRAATRNTLIFLFGLRVVPIYTDSIKTSVSKKFVGSLYFGRIRFSRCYVLLLLISMGNDQIIHRKF